MSDILRLEEAFSGIYTDTDVKYKKPFPTPDEIEKTLKNNYSIFTSTESRYIRISNSILVRSFGCPVMAECRANIDKLACDGLIDTINFLYHRPEDIKVLFETGPYLLSASIVKIVFRESSDDLYSFVALSQRRFEFCCEKFSFQHVFPGVVDIPGDTTWTEEGRKIFEQKEWRMWYKVNCAKEMLKNAMKNHSKYQ